MASQTESTKDPWSSSSKEKFENKNLSEYYDPCQEAASRSLRCLHRNGGDRSMCHDYFQAYRDCKKEWVGNTPVLENHMVDPIIPASLTTIQLAKRKEDRAKMP